MPLALPIAAFMLSAGLLWLLLRPAVRRWLLDHPNHRSLHHAPVPRSGGIAIMAGATLALAVSGVELLVVWATLALVAISLVDDVRDVPAWARLLAHLAVATGFVLGSGIPQGWAPAFGLVLVAVWMINLYNFMDGADGLAGGMAAIGFATFGTAAWQHGEFALAIASFGVSGSALAFLLFNFPPARIFMGDAGSVPCGFLAAGIGMLGWARDAWPVWFPIVVFAPFVVDASVTLLRRLLRGERVWQAHRSHYYQRQVLMGWTHRQLALAEYALMAAGSCVALFALDAEGRVVWLLLGSLSLVYLALMVSVDVRWAKRGIANA